MNLYDYGSLTSFYSTSHCGVLEVQVLHDYMATGGPSLWPKRLRINLIKKFRMPKNLFLKVG